MGRAPYAVTDLLGLVMGSDGEDEDPRLSLCRPMFIKSRGTSKTAWNVPSCPCSTQKRTENYSQIYN